MGAKINVTLTESAITTLLSTIEGQRVVCAGQLKAARIAIGEGVNVSENLERVDDLLAELEATADAWQELCDIAPPELRRPIPAVDDRGMRDVDRFTEESVQRLFAVAEHFFGVLLQKPLENAASGRMHRAAAVRPVLERLHGQVKDLIALNETTGIPISRLENQGIRVAVEQSLTRIVRQDFEEDWGIASAFYETKRIQNLPWETFVGEPSFH